MMKPPLFASLRLVCDPVPGRAAYNMGLDEILLQETEQPLLRVYRWAAPAVSFGYFESWAAVRAAHPDREPVRRWTGGGVVLHGEDWTYSIIIPRADPVARMRAGVLYRLVHERVGEALRASVKGVKEVGFAPAKVAPVSRACFENPACDDLLVDGRKVAGAAQRRSRTGVLHQGSLLGVSVPEGFGPVLARSLADEVVAIPPTPGEVAAAKAVASTRYATPGWLEKF